MEPVVEIKNVHQAFRTGFWMKATEVLHDVTFQVPKRAIFGFLGANGAGKTTLINLIVGLRKPTSGSVKVLGISSESPEARTKIGYLPERPYFHEHLTGRALLRYFGSLAGMKKNRLKARIPEVLTQVGMTKAADVELKNYSKGMLQRIGIAQALLHEPEFLVLDEPMSGLDPIGRKEIRELIVKLASEGRTVFFSTHVIPDVEAICDQVALIQKGKLIGCGPIGTFLTGGSGQIEIIFSSISENKLEEMNGLIEFRKIAEGFRGLVSTEQKLDQVLPKILAAGGHITSVTPIRPSLEDLFQKSEIVSETKGAGPL